MKWNYFLDKKNTFKEYEVLKKWFLKWCLKNECNE